MAYYSTKDSLDIADHAIAQKHKFPHAMFANRFEEMVRSVCWNGNGYSNIENVNIAKNWPSRGSARFTRSADGKRFKAFMSGNKFKVLAIT